MALISHPLLWRTFSLYLVPPLLWAPWISRLLAAFCVARQLLSVLQLYVACSTLFFGGPKGSAAGRWRSGASIGRISGPSSPVSPGTPRYGRQVGDRLGEVPAPGTGMALVSAMVQKRLGKTNLLEQAAFPEGRPLLEDDAGSDAKKALARVSRRPMVNQNNFQDERAASPERPNLVQMRRTRLATVTK